MSRAHTRRRSHAFDDSRYKPLTYTLQGVMWGSLTWPLFAAAAFVIASGVAHRKPHYRLND